MSQVDVSFPLFFFPSFFLATKTQRLQESESKDSMATAEPAGGAPAGLETSARADFEEDPELELEEQGDAAFNADSRVLWLRHYATTSLAVSVAAWEQALTASVYVCRFAMNIHPSIYFAIYIFSAWAILQFPFSSPLIYRREAITAFFNGPVKVCTKTRLK